MDPANVLFSSISGDHIEGVLFYKDKPPTRWDRISHHFLHFGEPISQVIGYVKSDGKVVWSR